MTDVMMLSLAPSACVLDNPLPSGPYRQQSKTRKRFSRNTPEAVKERLRRRRNREAAQDLRNRKKRYEMALQSKLDELNSDVDNLTAEERMLLEEQKQLQRQLQATLTGRPLMAPSVAEDVDSDSKAWAMARPRVTVGGLDSPVSEPETTMMVGPSIEPADELPPSLWSSDGTGSDVLYHESSSGDDLSDSDDERAQAGTRAGVAVGDWGMEPALERGRRRVGPASEHLANSELRRPPHAPDVFRDWVTMTMTGAGRQGYDGRVGETMAAPLPPPLPSIDSLPVSPPLSPMLDLSVDQDIDDAFIAEILGSMEVDIAY
eukprot:m.80024 g.80024  ORF g.80024 m.80024 type:complete len:318 (-) comp9318_c0_seq1:205-1158(-)